jgi:putative ABC transport system substrate-binding protein
MAADLVRRRVSLIVTMGNNLAARAAKAATTMIPIVFAMGADPLQTGLVTSLNRPGGNVTGVTVFSGDSVQKRMQLLHDLLPDSKVFGFLANPDNLGSNTSDGRTALEQAQDAVRIWGGTLQVALVRSVSGFDAAFKSLGEKRIDALGSTSDAMFNSGRGRLIALAAQYSMPTVHISTEDTRAGGLMSYSASQTDAHRQAGFYAARILKGEKPADLPVLLPTRFEFAINLKTAKTLGLTIPPGLLAIADVVIE